MAHDYQVSVYLTVGHLLCHHVTEGVKAGPSLSFAIYNVKRGIREEAKEVHGLDNAAERIRCSSFVSFQVLCVGPAQQAFHQALVRLSEALSETVAELPFEPGQVLTRHLFKALHAEISECSDIVGNWII